MDVNIRNSKVVSNRVLDPDKLKKKLLKIFFKQDTAKQKIGVIILFILF